MLPPVFVWRARRGSHDIKFLVSLVGASGTVPVLPSRQVAAGCDETGEFEAPEDCLLTFSWDNTYSKMRSKTVTYEIDVTVEAQPEPEAD